MRLSPWLSISRDYSPCILPREMTKLVIAGLFIMCEVLVRSIARAIL